VDVDPNYATARSHLGLTLYVRRNYEDAIIQLNKAIELGARTEDNYYILGYCYAYLDQCEEARAAFQESLNINPFSDLAKQGIAQCTD